MIKIIREKQKRTPTKYITTINCSCGAILEANPEDFNDQDYFIFPIGGSEHLHCPECGEKHYLYGASHGQGSRSWNEQIE